MQEAESNIEAGTGAGRYKVSLRIEGSELDPAIVTELLGVEPSFAARRGETVTRHHRTYVQKNGIWTHRMETQRGWALDEAIVSLLSKFPNDPAIWRKLSSSYRVEVFCGLFMGSDNQADNLQSSTLLVLGERGIALSLVEYGP